MISTMPKISANSTLLNKLGKSTRGLISLLVLLGISNSTLAKCGTVNSQSETASGYVYIDQNQNGTRENSETGIVGVSVSNGCEVTLTDNTGHYDITLAPMDILFVSQPSGYKISVDENNIPQFYYRHYPDGTPSVIAGTSVQWRWPVTEATGALPASIDFALTLDESASTQFTAYGFADPQAKFELGEDMMREDLVNTLIGNPYSAAFGITVGDVVFDTLSLYDRHKDMMSLMDVPQWYLPGNHDINYESPDSLFANETYKLHFGPIYYSFNQGNVHFISLNNVEYAGADKEIDGARYRGWIPDDQLYWLQQDLAKVAKDKLIVIATHIPLVAGATDNIGPTPAIGPGTKNFAALLELLKPFENLYAIAGHDTSNSWKVEINHSHGWQGQPWIAHTLAEVRGNGWLTGPADLRGVRDAMMQDGNPNGFYLLKFDDDQVVPEFIPFPFGADGGKAMRIVLDPQLSFTGTGINRGILQAGSKVVVNLFDGGVRDSLWISLDQSERTPMIYTVRTDPFAERVYEELKDSDSEISRPTLSGHIWEYLLPDTLMPGVHRIEVFSEDEFGQARRGAISFEIVTQQTSKI
ncbi:MAG: hypothetical protein COA96_11840 [SAR86 cluster bacterium]|uniref:Cna protein B-type domain containing protein n=1 Tax=SAR86 cluster bacterium TaxID=2030880 RepID=A0A2A5AW20_9GAMM|nr:MAG: hypothetical protein COA96_11840 [SAR86 cluster bacterium]